jgi:hypothetical protein
VSSKAGVQKIVDQFAEKEQVVRRAGPQRVFLVAIGSDGSSTR